MADSYWDEVRRKNNISASPSLSIPTKQDNYWDEVKRLNGVLKRAPLGNVADFRKLDEASRGGTAASIPTKATTIPSSAKPERQTTYRQPTEAELKSPVTQFTAGLAETTIPRAVSSMQKLSTGKAPLAERMKAESKPYSNAVRTAGTIAGELATQPLTYGFVGKSISGASALQKIGSPFLRNVVGGQIADTLIQTPGVIISGAAEGKSAGEIVKDVGKEQLTDLAGNVLFGGAESLLKGISNKLKAGRTLTQAEADTVQNATKQMGGDTTESLDDQIKRIDDWYQSRRTGATETAAIDNIPRKTSSGTVDNIPRNTAEMPEPAAKVSLNTKKQKSPLNLYARIVDSQNPLSKLSKATGDKTAVLSSNSRNAGGTVDYILKDALVDRQGNVIGESLQDVANRIPKGKEQAFWDYMMQRGNIDRAREGKAIISNYTPEMSAEAARIAETNNPEFKAIGDNVTGWIDQFMRTWGVDAGTVDETLYNQLRETYKSYVPTQREFSELEKAIPGGVSRKFVDQSTPIKKATGSDRNIKNPLENIMNLVNRTVRTEKYNEVGQELLKSVREGKTDLAEIIPAADGMFANTDNIVTVLEGGKPVYLRINDKELLDALEGLPKTVNNLPGLRKVTGKYKALITQKNPIFAARNVARDIPTAYVYGSTANPITFAKDYAGALKDIATNSENYQRYKAVGGGMSNFFKQGDTVAKDLTGNKNILQKIGGAIENFNNMAETAPRLAEFNRTLSRTGDIDKALYAANDVTVNFARGGNWTKAAEPIVPYLNAGVQGLDKLYQTVKDPKKFVKALAAGGIGITAPTIALFMVNKDNPNYQGLDNRTKDNYFLIPNALGEKDENGNPETFIKIPKARELGVLFGALFERAIRAGSGEENAWKGFGNTVATNLSPTNPIENNFFAPIYNLRSNKDFANRDIVPRGMVMDERSKYLQYDEKTTEIAKKIGELSHQLTGGEGLSPKQIDYLVKSYTGVIGQLGIPLATKGGNPVKAVTTQFTSDSLYSSQTLTDFYDNFNKYTKSAKDKNLLENIPTKDVTPQEQIRNMYSKASDKMSELNKLSAKVTAGNLTADDTKALQEYGIPSTDDTEATARKIKAKVNEIAKEANKLNPSQFNRTIPDGIPTYLTQNKERYDLSYQEQYELSDLVNKYKKLYGLKKGWSAEQVDKAAKDRAYAEMKRKLFSK